VDIRSDLYSLGLVLWKMVTGHGVFKGSPAEVVHQHQHAPLPIEELEHVPQPVAFLLEVLLEKDPTRRFQSPAELLKAMLTVTSAIDVGRTVTRQSLQKMSPPAWRGAARKPSAKLGPKKISVARLPVTGSDVFGREEDIARRGTFRSSMLISPFMAREILADERFRIETPAASSSWANSSFFCSETLGISALL
jgi:serine/threonine protein kinase